MTAPKTKKKVGNRENSDCHFSPVGDYQQHPTEREIFCRKVSELNPSEHCSQGPHSIEVVDTSTEKSTNSHTQERIPVRLSQSTRKRFPQTTIPLNYTHHTQSNKTPSPEELLETMSHLTPSHSHPQRTNARHQDLPFSFSDYCSSESSAGKLGYHELN